MGVHKNPNQISCSVTSDGGGKPFADLSIAFFITFKGTHQAIKTACIPYILYDFQPFLRTKFSPYKFTFIDNHSGLRLNFTYVVKLSSMLDRQHFFVEFYAMDTLSGQGN